MIDLTRERGSTAVEVALIAPVLLALLMVVVVAFRITQAEAEVSDVAGEAARAASLQRAAGPAAAAARSTAQANLDSGPIACTEIRITTDTSSFSPGGLVTVTVTCIADLSDVLFVAVGRGRTVTATAREVLDVYRGVDG